MRIIMLCGRSNIIVRFFYHDISNHEGHLAVQKVSAFIHANIQITYTVSFGRGDEKRNIIFICFTWKNLTNERRKSYNIPNRKGSRRMEEMTKAKGNSVIS